MEGGSGVVLGMCPVPWEGFRKLLSVACRAQPLLSSSGGAGAETCWTEFMLVLPAVLLGSANNPWKHLSFEQI